MVAEQRPRNIRDIAHLYLSRYPQRGQSPLLNIFLRAETTDCFSGFHAANFAAAFAMNGARVRVFELSGLLPNVAYYFSSPPHVYLKPHLGPSKGFSPGLNAISVAFDPVRLMSQHMGTGGVWVNLVHLPVPATPNRSEELFRDLRERSTGERWGLYLTRDEHSASAESFFDPLGVSTPAFRLLLRRTRSLAGRPGGPGNELGQLCHWESAVSDRVPAVLRNPKAGLAREYLSACESMLGRIHSMRRRRAVERGAESSLNPSAR